MNNTNVMDSTYSVITQCSYSSSSPVENWVDGWKEKKIESHLRLLCMIPNLIWVGEMGMLVGDSLSGHLLTGVITKRASGLAIALK
jgi:hypothetical protein